jgi:hypothetical protein
MSTICYLCGLDIPDAELTQDHVPPKQFFAAPLRKVIKPSRLVTLAAHRTCNESYRLDEEYFTWELGSIAAGTLAADALNAYNASKFRAGESEKLGLKILSEFEDRPSGLWLPRDLVIKRVEGDRLKRVAWKVVRGLYRVETGQLLPEGTTFALDLREPENRDPSDLDELWERVKAQPSRGAYAGVFDYKYLDAKVDSGRLHGWGMLLWDQVIVFIGHLHPGTSSDAAT